MIIKKTQKHNTMNTSSLAVKKEMKAHYVQTEELTLNKKVKSIISSMLLEDQKITKVIARKVDGLKVWYLKNQSGVNIFHVTKEPTKGLKITYWR